MKPLVLIPSPLNGPAVWAPVSRELRRLGGRTLVIAVADKADSSQPFWLQHATSVAAALNRPPFSEPVVLVGHSGTGPLLPAIGAFSPQPVAGYIFVDAALPHPEASRLDEMAANVPELVEQLRPRLEAGGQFPEWTDAEAQEVIPDAGLRAAVLGELRPRRLDFFSETFPDFGAWPDAPCAYLQFSPAYEAPAAAAREMGWPVRTVPGGHFEMLATPSEVAEALSETAAAL